MSWTKQLVWAWPRHEIVNTKEMKNTVGVLCWSARASWWQKQVSLLNQWVYYECWGSRTDDTARYHSALMSNVSEMETTEDTPSTPLCVCVRLSVCLCVFSVRCPGEHWVGGLAAVLLIWSSLRLDAIIISSFILSNLCRGQRPSLRSVCVWGGSI